jgi:hypothetical protein
MIIGHIPAGYIFSKLAYGRFSNSIGSYRTFLWWGILGAITPDLDLLWFYFADHGHIHHHEYFTHYPITWLALIILSSAFCSWKPKRRTSGCYMLAFSISGLFHLILDTIGGDIWWLAPLVDHPYSLATIVPRFRTWQLNFVFHWSFILELTLAAWAVRMWLPRTDLPARHPSAPRNDLSARHSNQSSDVIDRHAPISSSNHPS